MMSDPFPSMEPWEAYEAACKRIEQLEAERDAMRMALTVLVSYRDYMHPGDVKIAEEALEGSARRDCLL